MSEMRRSLPAALLLALCSLVIAFASACGSDDDATPTPAAAATTPGSPAPAGALTLTSAAFANNASIPADFSCDGRNSSPPLAWTGVPATAKALVLLLDDPDAPSGNFDHWVLYAIPPELPGLDAGISPKPGILPAGVIEGVNGAGKLGYTGPCPPRGQEHHYTFRLYALDGPVALAPGKTKADVLEAIKDHTLARATLIGLYRRP